MIYNLAKHVRDSIEANKTLNLSNFPIGCCDYASWLLWKYLNEKGIHDFNRRFLNITYKHKTRCHVWLENETHVLDITGDQFNNVWKNIRFDRITYIPKENYFFSENHHKNRVCYDLDLKPYEDCSLFFLNPDSSMINFEEFYSTKISISKNE